MFVVVVVVGVAVVAGLAVVVLVVAGTVFTTTAGFAVEAEAGIGRTTTTFCAAAPVLDFIAALFTVPAVVGVAAAPTAAAFVPAAGAT